MYKIQYNDNEGTDIALGLERAEAWLREGGSLSEDGRKPVIILLSDGKNDLETKNKNGISFYQLGVSCSNAASEKALAKMINLFEEQNVSVFTIGLNV